MGGVDFLVCGDRLYFFEGITQKTGGALGLSVGGANEKTRQMRCWGLFARIPTSSDIPQGKIGAGAGVDCKLCECTGIASGNIEDVSKEPHTVCFYITVSRRAPFVSCVFPDGTLWY